MPKQTAAQIQPAAMPDVYYDFVYVSRAVISGDIPAELLRIQTQAKACNKQHGLRGALIYQAGYFLQWLEGPKATLEKLIQKLEQDSRHKEFQILLFEPQRTPLAADWSMGTVTRDESAQALDARVQSIIRDAKSERWGANDIVRRFVKPVSVRGGVVEGKSTTVARVSVLGSNAMWPSALIHHIAKAEKLLAVEQTRFSRLDAPQDESVTEYVDLAPSPGALLRISSFSGWMTQSPLFDLLRSEDQVLVVMFKSANTAATLEYTAGILAAHQSKKSLILGVFSPRAALQADAFLDYAKRAGFVAQVLFAPLAEPAEIWDAVRQLSHGALKTMFSPPAPPAPPVVALRKPAAPTPAPHQPPSPPAPPPKVVQEKPVAKQPKATVLAAPQLDAKLQAALTALLSGEPAVKDWAAWAQHDLAYLAGTTPREAPAEELRALEALQSKLDPTVPVERLSVSSQGRFEWIALLPWQASSVWVQVLLHDNNLSFGMVQYLSNQWKASFP